MPSYEAFENRIHDYLDDNYFPFLYQPLYNQLGYEKMEGKKFTTSKFKEIIRRVNFVYLVNDIYHTKVSNKGLENINKSLEEIDDFDDYETTLSIFEKVAPKTIRGKEIEVNAFSFGTKLLHFYDPEKNPILDSVVKQRIKMDIDLDLEFCLEFRKATNRFVEKHPDYFDKFYKSEIIVQGFNNMFLTNKFPKMQIVDMILYY